MRRKRSSASGLLRAAVLLAVLAAAALAGLYFSLRSRAEAFARGAVFALDYTVESTAEAPSAAYRTFETFGALSGRLEGEAGAGALALSFFAPGQDAPFLDLYSGDGTFYLNAGRLYRTYTAALAEQYPLLGALIPGWGLGDYLSAEQLALLLGQETSAQSAAPAAKLVPVRYAEGKDGYLYLAPEGADPDAPGLRVGVRLATLFSDEAELHILAEDPANALRFVLTGAARAEAVTLSPPDSRMADEDVEALRAVFDAVQALVEFMNG